MLHVDYTEYADLGIHGDSAIVLQTLKPENSGPI